MRFVSKMFNVLDKVSDVLKVVQSVQEGIAATSASAKRLGLISENQTNDNNNNNKVKENGTK